MITRLLSSFPQARSEPRTLTITEVQRKCRKVGGNVNATKEAHELHPTRRVQSYGQFAVWISDQDAGSLEIVVEARPLLRIVGGGVG